MYIPTCIQCPRTGDPIQISQSCLAYGNISDPPPDSSWSYRATDSAFMADGPSVWLVRRSGIPCWTACRIQLLAGTVLDIEVIKNTRVRAHACKPSSH